MVKPALLPSLAIVLGLSVGLTGCGDDSSISKDETTTTVKALSADELRTEADKICAQVSEDSQAVGDPTELADLETMGPKLLSISEQGVSDLEALAAPKADQATMTELIGILKESNTALEGLEKAAKDGDEDAATQALDDSSAKIAEFADKAKAEGFDDCGTVGAGSDDSGDTTDTTEAPATDTSFSDIDLGEQLNPIEGFTYETLPADARTSLIDALGNSAEVKELVSAIGTTTVTDASGTSLLIFLGLNRELSTDEASQLVDGITAGGTNVEQGEVAGQTGWAYVSSDGQQGFVTVRNQTVIIGLSDSSDHLAAVIQGLFTANPDL